MGSLACEGHMPTSTNLRITDGLSRPVSLMINGTACQISDIRPDTTLLEVLRRERGLVGSKEGCAEGDCGACTVMIGRLRQGRIEYQPINACIFLLPMADKSVIRTVEGVARDDGALHPVQQALVDHHGSQGCFCIHAVFFPVCQRLPGKGLPGPDNRAIACTAAQITRQQIIKLSRTKAASVEPAAI